MRRVSHAIVLVALLALVGLGWSLPAAAQVASGPIYLTAIDGIVTSVTTGYLRRVLHEAEASNANALIIQLGNRGAVLRDVRVFAGEIAAARVPVVVYVAPAGVDSGAAGELFLSAAHVSAMAPNTSFGSPAPLAAVDATLTQQTRDLLLDSVADQIRAWNGDRGRNTAWITRAVREGVVLTNQQASALQPRAVDIVAANRDELLTLLEGRQIKLHDGRTVQLVTLGRPVTEISPSASESLRLALSNPTIAFVLLVMGVLAICLELAAPGTSIFAGIGIVLLAAAAVGLLALPVRWWAVLLLLVASGMVIAEFAAHTHGVLAVTGIALLTVSALNLIDPAQAPGAVIAAWIIVLVGLALAALVALGIWLAVRTRGRPAATGQEAMIGKLAEVRQRLDPDGMVFVEGALWQALSEDGVAEVGDWVRVAAVHDLRLVVRRLDSEVKGEVKGEGLDVNDANDH